MAMLTVIVHFACCDPGRIVCLNGLLCNVLQSEPPPILIFRQTIIFIIVIITTTTSTTTPTSSTTPAHSTITSS